MTLRQNRVQRERPVETAAASSDETPPAIAVEGLRKEFGSGADAVAAVDDVSFAVEAGSVVGLLGPNGAGKTTTIKSILGMVLPDSGSVRIHGVGSRTRARRTLAWTRCSRARETTTGG